MSLEVKVDVSGLQRVIANEPKRVDAWLRGVAITMVGDIKLSFNTGPAGRSYKRGKSRYHIASSPGNPPNSDTGALVGSIRQAAAGNLTYHIQSSGDYGPLLEYGTSKMSPRKFMGPVFDDWRGSKIEDDAKKNLDLE
jgi:hypothetical protein